MKPRPPRSNPQRCPPAANSTQALPPERKWLFRISATLLPVLALALLEILLRVFGYGYPTGFFKKVEIDGQQYYINNDTFTLRFFPSELARWPGTLKIPVTKPPDVTRLFIFGESAAMGDPQPAYGASRYLEVLLRERFPDMKFEVVNVSITAVNSHVILPIARECAKRDGDFWIIYMGNNEMVGPFGAATVFGSRAPPRAMVRLNLAIQRLRVGQLAMAGMRKLAGKPDNTSWGGMQMFLQNQLPPDDPRREMVYQNFEENLGDILRAGLDSGVKVMLNTVSVNLKDCPPFASSANSNLNTADLAAFTEASEEGLSLQKQGKHAEAAQSLERAARFNPHFAELQFRWAESLLLSSNVTAQTNYQLACDYDALPFRADSRINATIRGLAREFGEASLVLSDAEAALADASHLGIAGQEVFFEHVHFNFRGNYLLARLWADRILGLLPENFASPNSQDWASQETCDRLLGLTPWNRGFVIDSVIRRMQQPPLSSQFNNRERLAMLQVELQNLRAQQLETNAIMQNGQAVVDAIQRAPQDAFLYEGFANFLEALGDHKQAAGEYRKLLEFLPHDFYAKLQLGRLLGEMGRPAEGEPLLQEAARQRPTVPDVWAELGDVQMAQQKYDRALESYTRGSKLRPRDASYICYQANALAKLNRRTEAIATYRRAIELRPDISEAHFELAGLLATENQVSESLREYGEAIRLNPRHAVSRINFGVMLVRQNRLDEAIQQFELALQIEPTNAAAADYLRQVREQRNKRKSG